METVQVDRGKGKKEEKGERYLIMVHRRTKDPLVIAQGEGGSG